ncbi:DUF5615 family PIN-like protein [Anabaena azotica]|uniref:DUF5615 family PIN-like protein n=1 Tax=Anabaena azotica TaxID=197653 RepID=UPI0039A539A5
MDNLESKAESIIDNVTTTSEAGLIGVSDREQIAFALSENRILITHDDDFVILHRSGITHAGITYCRGNAVQ